MQDINIDKKPIINHAEFSDGQRKAFVVIDYTMEDKQTKVNGEWQKLVKERERFDPKTKKLLKETYTPQIYAIRVYEKDDSLCEVRTYKTNPYAATAFMKDLFAGKKDVSGIEIVLEKVANGVGFNPSVLPVGA